MKKTIREFVKDKLDGKVLSDNQLIEKYWHRYMMFWNYSSIVKKWDSIIRILLYMRQEWQIKEVKRKRHWYSEEIFYKLVGNES